MTFTTIMTPPNPLSKNDLKRGDVVLVTFPNSDLRTAKLRPALVVQSDDLDSELSQIVVAMISSNLKRAGRESRVLIETSTHAGKRSGLLFDSVVVCDNLATVSLRAVNRVIGHLDETNDIDEALKHTLRL